MTEHNARKGLLNTLLCLTATSLIGACGGGSEDDTAATAQALIAAPEARANLELAAAASIDMALARTGTAQTAPGTGLLASSDAAPLPAPVDAPVGSGVEPSAGPMIQTLSLNANAPTSSAPSRAKTTAAPASAPFGNAESLNDRMQLFADGSLKGFAIQHLGENGIDAYVEKDFEDLAATGANVVRVPLLIRRCTGCQIYDEPTLDIAYVKRILDLGAKFKFRVIVTLVPMPFPFADYWDNESLKSDIVRKWELIALNLRDSPALVAYDLINEPVMGSAPRSRWTELSSRIAKSLRVVDPRTPIMVEPADWGLPDQFWQNPPIDMPGIVYSFHFYDPHWYTHQGLAGYPTPVALPPDNGQETIRDAKAFAKQNKVPMFVGEFSVVRWAPGANTWLTRTLKLMAGERFGFTYHCWRCWQGMDAEVAPDAPTWTGPWPRSGATEAMISLINSFKAKP